MRAISTFIAISLSLVCSLQAGDVRSKRELKAGLQAAESYNWTEAASHLRYAEGHLPVSAPTEELLARIVFMRATMEQRNLAQLTREYEVMSRRSLVQESPELRMWLYIAKGDCDNDLQFPEAARRDWQIVKELAAVSNNPKWIYRAKGELAIPAYYMGNLASSRKLVTEALESAAAAKDNASLVRLLTHIGAVYMMRGNFASGMEHLKKAETLAASIPGSEYPVTVKESELLGLIGTGKLIEATNLANDIIARMHRQDRRINEAQTRVMLATIYRKQRNLPAAIRELTTAIRMSKAGSYYHSLADAQVALANIYLEIGKLSGASSSVASSIESMGKSGIVSDLPERMRLLANLRTQQRRYAEANSIYKKAEDEIDAQLALTPMSSKQLLLKSTSDIYTDHFELAAKHFHDVGDEYEIVERVRGRMLTDLLKTASFSNLLADSSAEREVSALRLQLASARTADEVARAREAIFFARHKRWLHSEMGATVSLRHSSETVLPISVVQKSLAASELLIEYIAGSRSVYALVITTQKARVSEIGSTRTINDAVTHFVDAVRNKQDAVAEGTDLYNLLFGTIPEATTHSNLVLVPDGQLHAVPFAALVTNGKRLVETHSLVRAPSASAYVLLHQRNMIPVRDGLLAVGGVRYNPDLARTAKARGYGDQLSNLPGSQEEADEASEMLGPRLGKALTLEDKSATESAVKDALRQEREVVHMAVHGVSHTKDDPELAALVFLQDKNSGEDGLLEVPEILQLRLRSDLVVLSACETAVGEVEGEEGVSNLSRSFLLAGAASVTSTLWAVDDVFSATLMKHFYQSLAAGRSKADALEAAQRYVLRQFNGTAVPWYWAGYVMEGDATEPLPSFRSDASHLGAAGLSHGQ